MAGAAVVSAVLAAKIGAVTELEGQIRAEAARRRQQVGPSRVPAPLGLEEVFRSGRGMGGGPLVSAGLVAHEQPDSLAGRVRQVLAELVAVPLRRPFASGQLEFNQALGAVMARLGAEAEQRLSGLEARLDRLAGARDAAGSGFDFEDFERRFRGPREHTALSAEESAYRSFLCGGAPGPILDFGCGRGAFLGGLVAAGREALGVDTRPEAVQAARERGAAVHEGDGLAFLSDLPNASLGGLVALQVVEHVEAEVVLQLLSLAVSRLRPGGRMVLETVNPEDLVPHSRAFPLDPSHARLLHPKALAEWATAAGLEVVEIRRSGAAAIDMRLEHAWPSGPLEHLIGEAQDYALFAERPRL